MLQSASVVCPVQKRYNSITIGNRNQNQDLAKGRQAMNSDIKKTPTAKARLK